MVQKRVHIFVNGRVQGVFFRQATRVIAIKNNVNGWVKNLENSQVEILLEGEETDVNLVVDWCRHGPANSRVDKIEINQQIFVGELLNFEVLY